MVRTGLKMLIESWSGVQVVGEVGTPAEAVQAVEVDEPDILLLDLDFTGDLGGLEHLQKLGSEGGETRIIVLTDMMDSEAHLRAVRMGAMGVVCKKKSPDDLRKAIEKVHSGEAWLDRSLTASVIAEISRKPKPDPEVERIATLTERERQVAALVCEGLANGAIGDRLFITETTVRHHLTSIFSKLEVSNRFELAIFLYRHKFADTPKPVSRS
jgi:DNA-binding NarL/FixJ family response regulator